ncbi:MAG TPA: LamG-like jellyroll fold domain-containing protein, partial [Candidatus Binatia bacterium]
MFRRVGFALLFFMFAAHAFAIAEAGDGSPKVASAAAAAQLPPAGLVAAYAFNEGKGATTNDVSGRGHTGTLSAAKWVSKGKFGKALSFSGKNSLVSIAANPDLDLTNGMTLEAWVFPKSKNGAGMWRNVIAKERPGGGVYNLYSHNDTSFPTLVIVPNSTNTPVDVRGSAQLPRNVWSHLAATYDGSTLRLYINGNLAGSRALSDTVSTSTNPLRIGGDTLTKRFFQGLIDEVRIYDRALSQSEIQSDMNTPLESTRPPAPTLPTVKLTAPANRASVAGATTVSANAADDSGHVSVQFLLDGIGLGAEQTHPPFSFLWDTTRVPNGRHTLSARARDGAGNIALAADVTVTVNNAAGDLPPTYPVKVGPTGRYLVDQNGVPFLMTGESPQAMIANLSEADAELFFQNRKSHGFNTVWINLLCAGGFPACRHDGSTFDGIVPFTAVLDNSAVPPFVSNYDLTTPNEAYFARAERILQIAAEYGFLVILDPIETISWFDVLKSNGVSRNRAYGQFLGQRFLGSDNIVWMHGNDYKQDQMPSAEDDTYTTAVALGIRDRDTRHLQTVELFFLSSSSLDDDRWASLIQLNAAYTYFPTYQEILKDYNRPDFLPVF